VMEVGLRGTENEEECGTRELVDSGNEHDV
jgi:hypothetical protein